MEKRNGGTRSFAREKKEEEESNIHIWYAGEWRVTHDVAVHFVILIEQYQLLVDFLRTRGNFAESLAQSVDGGVAESGRHGRGGLEVLDLAQVIRNLFAILI